jgi:hypothetical protein
MPPGPGRRPGPGYLSKWEYMARSWEGMLL